ncbi:xanthine dehydrogenase accessory protein XdhC [Microbulbifer rhizosphaerae]|uniref:Xanthine dehydrogenase accessory factor n=1 Tax=Microbulbifer rhizosphaerae TaxID=1562603 RepID=A0A7W4WFS7_9GAMM|nr:xanthine dehydrogenase accessory protein XdhC [Microbulbifer rhizosphaerae]MBB3062873.1 xanthine dehydrogenase accessory factor [Microbulbifer rhizosphaerae]
MINSTPWFQAAADCRRRGEPWVLATVLSSRGSAPRDSGSKMVIHARHSFDTLGGGQLEFQVIARARELIADGRERQLLEHFPLSARAGQCCGGSVTVLLECFAGAELQLHLFGAGHVARALLPILSPLDWQLHWIDSRAELLSDDMGGRVHCRCLGDPVEHVSQMPSGAFALILTQDHSLDYRLLAALLDRGDCAYLGMIGSRTKALRFRRRLAGESFAPAQIESFHSPVGLPQVRGKRPAEVAISIAAQLLVEKNRLANAVSGKSTGVDWKTLRESLGGISL